ncbi:MAG: M48 family metallopeptidase [Candidatus Omnitrophica bacterium]|nr:M48 family metallopeptidase [Candidatus Omnitrophota bacterium]
MNRKSIRRNLTLSLCALFLLTSCATVPLTGRRQLDLLPSGTMLTLSFQQYDDFIKTNKVITGTPESRLVKEVGRRIADAVEEYLRANGQSARIANYQWEFNLVQSDEANAWCLPGGKVVVYSGLLPITQDATGLAVVMGHEIAHAVAKHGDERMSQGMIASMGTAALSVAMESSPQETQQVWMSAFGLGAQYGVMLPFSRLHESEADHLGLIFMALAGYDPAKAVNFWERMAQMKGGAGVPEFMSSHPSDRSRIQRIHEQLPEAKGYYRK